MAVEDRVRAAPIARAATGGWPSSHGSQAQGDRAADDLGRAQAEDQLAHQPQPLPRQLQPDHEQQEHDAELGQLGDLVGIVDGDIVQPRRDVNQAAQAERPQDHPGQQEAEDGIDLQALEERRDDARGGQEQDQVLVVRW
jgi:hypothetical protein